MNIQIKNRRHKGLCGIRLNCIRFALGVALVVWCMTASTAVALVEFTRLGDSGSQAGRIGLLDSTPLTGTKLLTAVSDGSSNLKLISWQVSADGQQVERLGDSGSQAGFVDRIAMAKLSHARVVTAVRTGQRNLMLIVWGISPTGDIQRLADTAVNAGFVDKIAIASLTSTRVVTAVKDGGGNLKLITWEISQSGRSISRRGEQEAGKIKSVDIVTLTSERVVTTTKEDRPLVHVEGLVYIVWDISSTGQIERRGRNEGGGGLLGQVKLFRMRLFTMFTSGLDDRVAEIVDITPEGELISMDGSRFLLGQELPGQENGGAMVYWNLSHVLSAGKDSRGDLQLVAWAVPFTGPGLILRDGDSGSQAGRTKGQRLHILSTLDVVTVVKTGDNTLKLIVWSVDDEN